MALPLMAWTAPAGAVTLTIPPNQVMTASPAVGLTTPADGRLRGQDFTATVTGVAWPGSVRSGGAVRVAGPGRRLVVFTLRVSQPTEDVGPPSNGMAATAVVTIGGDKVPVALTSLDEQIEGAHSTTGMETGTESLCLSVPVDQHDVDLAIGESGFSQRFDLWTLERVPPAPAVLYRPGIAANRGRRPAVERDGGHAVVTIGGDKVPVALTSLDEQIEGAHSTTGMETGTESLCLSVPVDQHDVDLAIGESGFSQRFDLWTLERVPPAPAVLYRDATSSSITVPSPGVENDPIESAVDGFGSPADVSLTSATLTYFAPDGSGTTPNDPDKAYLVADLVATHPGGGTSARHRSGATSSRH